MASFIAPLLKDALSKYFSNFDAEKLTLGMFGNVTLSDLALQTDVLDQFNLPFRVLGGRVGKLYLDIGLGGLAKLAMGSTTIIEATLTDVHILAVPPSTFPYDKEKAEAAILAKKRSELSSIVEKQKASAEAAAKGDSGESSGGGFVPNLILGVINNIKVKIENIHIRYEDDKMKPESPFSFGIVFGSLEAETCDKDWEPAKVELDPTFFKLVQVKSYGFYWNSYEKNLIGANKEANDESLDAIVTEMKALTEEGSDGKLKYVLGPLETKVKAMVTLNPEKLETPFSLPKADVKIEMPELKIGLSNEQFGEALILGESMEAMQRAMPYRKYRPFHTPVKGHAKEWWKFAFNCTQDELKRRKQNCTWDFWKAHRELVKKYTAAYPAIARGTATDEEKEEAQKLEDQMDNISIMTVRNKIDLTVTREKEMIKAKSGYWSTYELTTEDMDEILTKGMSDEEKLAYTTKVEEEAKPVPYPKDADYVEIRANVDLAKTVLNISNTSKDSDKIDNVLKLVIDKFSASAETHPEKQGLRVDAAMSTISITGLEQEGRPLPQLLKSVGEEGTEFVSFTFEKNPFDSKAGSRVKFSSLRTDVIYHAPTVQKLVDTFTWPDQVELSSAKASMSSSIDNFKQSSLDGMQDAVKDTSSQIDVDIKITAPRILVPQNGELSDTASVLIVNLGTLTVKSISHADAETLDLKALAENTNVDPALAKLVYNEYAVKLSDFEVLMALAGENLDLPGYTATLGEAGPLLKKGQIVVELSQSKITTDPRFPKLKVEVQIPLLDVDISESRMDKLMQLGLTFPVPVMAPPRPSIVDVKNDAKANYDAEVAKLTSSTVAISGAAEKKEKVEQVIPSDFDPETATQLTNIFCHVDIQGIKLRVSKVEGNAELIPVLDILLGVVDATVKMRTYGIGVKATLSGFVVTYSGAKIRGYDGPVNLLETPSGSGAPLLTVDVFMLSDDSPKPASGSVKQRINAQITSLNVILHQEAINALLVAADRIKNNLAKIKDDQAAKTFVIAGASGSEEAKADALVAQKAAKSAKAEENPNDLAMKVNAVLTSFTLQLTCEAKRITEVAIRQLAVEYDDGPVKSTAVVKLEAVEILDKAESAKYPKIVSVTGTEKLLYVKVLLFKESATRGETEPDIDVTLNLGSPRLMIIGSFFGNVLNFVTNFQEAADAVAKASAEASKNAMEAVKDAYESNAAKIKVQLKIGAPEIFVPRSATSNEVLALVLGEFQINNGFTSVASNVANRNAIVDTATVSLAGVSLGKAILDDNSNIIVQSMFIEPITLKFDFGRNLSSSWYKELPQFRVDADLEQFIVIIASEDVSFGMLCLLDVGKSLLEVKTKPKTQAIEADSPLGPQARMLTIQMAGSVQEKPEEKADTRTWLFSLKGKIKKIGVAFYTGPTNLENRTGSVPRDAGLSIGELSIQTASCSAEVWTNMDITANITINDAVIKDTRVATSNVITNCLTKKSDREGVQSTAPILAVDFSQTLQSSGQKLIDAGIQTTGVEFVINFDFFKAVLDVLMKIKDEVPEIIDEAKKCQKALAGDEGASDEDEVEVVAPVEQVEEAKPSNMLINGKVRFDELNVLILEDATTTDTNAIELTLGGTFDVNSKVTETHGSGEIKFGFATTNYRTRAIKKLAEIVRFSALKIKVDLTPERKVDVDIVYPDLACRFSAEFAEITKQNGDQTTTGIICGIENSYVNNYDFEFGDERFI